MSNYEYSNKVAIQEGGSTKRPNLFQMCMELRDETAELEIEMRNIVSSLTNMPIASPTSTLNGNGPCPTTLSMDRELTDAIKQIKDVRHQLCALQEAVRDVVGEIAVVPPDYMPIIK